MAGSLSYLIILFLAGSWANLVRGEEPLFRNDYTYMPDAEILLKEHLNPKNWSDAVEMCFAEGACLFTPKTEAEAKAAVQILNNNTMHMWIMWIGLHDRFSEGDFVTVDGKYVSQVYTDWLEGEPNNKNDIEDCVIMRADGKYNDDNCSTEFGYMCAKNPKSLTSYNHLCESYDLNYVYSSITDRCYKMHTRPKSWQDAFKICKAEQSWLAVINSEDEAAVLVDLVAKFSLGSMSGTFDKENIFLGFSDIISNGHFKTVDGKTLENSGYEAWATGQPDNYNNEEHCGAMLRDGKLSDRNCLNIATFICEKTLTDVAHVEPLNRFGIVSAKP